MQKTLSEEDWVQGGANYHSYLPFRPNDIFSLGQYYFMLFDEGFVVIEREVLAQEEHTTSFNSLCKPFYRSFSSWSDVVGEKIFSPKIYHRKEVEGEFELYLRQENLFFSLRWSAESSKFVLRWKKEIQGECLYAKCNNNGILAFSSGKKIVLLDDKGELEVVYEEKNPLYRIDVTPSRNEFGINDLFYWSPDGKKILFYQTDDSSVGEYPIVKIADPMASVEMLKYPMAGNASEKVHLSVLDLEKKNSVSINVYDDPITIPTISHFESYITSLTWSDDSAKILLCELERSQKYYQVKAYSAKTGKFIQFLWDERSEKYVEPENPFYCYTNSCDAECVCFLSQRSGHNHLYCFNTSENRVVPLTEGEWDVTRVYGFSSSKDALLFAATCHSPLGREVLSVSLIDRTVSVLSSGGGYNHLFYQENSDEIILCHESSENPGEIIFPFGKCLKVENPLQNVRVPRKKIGFINKKSGRLYYRIIFPVEETKAKVPVFFYVYGGPHVQLITDKFGSSTKGLEETMASSGFITFCIDPRGSANRGYEFESAIYQQINRPQMEDYDDALDWFLKEYEGYVDKTKLFIYGWSFGGYISLSMLLNSRHRFKLGIAGGAVVDWRYYEVMYTERYMGERKDSEQFYEKADLKEQIGKLCTPVCLIHCDNDPVVLWQHTLSLLKKANSLNGIAPYISYYLFPGHLHNVLGRERVQLTLKIKSLIINCL